MILQRRQGKPFAAAHVYRREAARPHRQQAILFYAIEALVAAEIRDITIVVSIETGEQVRRAAGDGSRFGARIAYVDQLEPGGIAQAIGSPATRWPARGSSRFSATTSSRRASSRTSGIRGIACGRGHPAQAHAGRARVRRGAVRRRAASYA